MAATAKIKIRSGDTVRVIAGRAKGKTARVMSVLRDESRVLLESVSDTEGEFINPVWKHTKPTAQDTQGSRLQREATIHLSNVMLVDDAGNATRVGRRIENGKLVRFSKKSGATMVDVAPARAPREEV